MNWFVFLSLLVSGSAKMVGVYVWGPTELDSETIENSNMLFMDAYSFIRLVIDDTNWLKIDIVQRGTEWPQNVSFCSLMVPAVIRDFLKRLNRSFLKGIEVWNGSMTLEIACRCYASVLKNFGFNELNGVVYSEPRKYCDKHKTAPQDYWLVEESDVMIGRPTSPIIGESTEEQNALLRHTTHIHIFELP